MSSMLFQEVDNLIDKKSIDKIMLTLEDDLEKYQVVRKELQYYKDQLTFIDKINPFGERDKKGEILKIQYELEDIARVYNQDMQTIKDRASEVIKSIDVFVTKFQMDWLIRSVQNISIRQHGMVHQSGRRSRGITIIGKEEALVKAENLNKTLGHSLGELYEMCPPYPKFIEAYMNYLTEPYRLPLKLKY